MLGFKVFYMDCNGKNIDFTSEELCNKFLEEVKEIEARLNISLPPIKSVVIGNEGYPLTEIRCENGLILYSKQSWRHLR